MKLLAMGSVKKQQSLQARASETLWLYGTLSPETATAENGLEDVVLVVLDNVVVEVVEEVELKSCFRFLFNCRLRGRGLHMLSQFLDLALFEG